MDKAKQDGVTALMLASTHGHLKVVRLLCLAGADKDMAGEDGATALINASYKGHLEVGRQGQGGPGWYHGLDVVVHPRSPGSGGAALQGRGPQARTRQAKIVPRPIEASAKWAQKTHKYRCLRTNTAFMRAVCPATQQQKLLSTP